MKAHGNKGEINNVFLQTKDGEYVLITDENKIRQYLNDRDTVYDKYIYKSIVNDELMKNNGINKTTTLERMAIYLLNEDKISFEEFCSLKRQHKLKINLCKTKENQLKKFSEEEIKQIQREGDAYECGVEGGLKVHKDFYFGDKNYNYYIYDYSQNPQELLKNVKNFAHFFVITYSS